MLITKDQTVLLVVITAEILALRLVITATITRDQAAILVNKPTVQVHLAVTTAEIQGRRLVEVMITRDQAEVLEDKVTRSMEQEKAVEMVDLRQGIKITADLNCQLAVTPKEIKVLDFHLKAVLRGAAPREATLKEVSLQEASLRKEVLREVVVHHYLLTLRPKMVTKTMKGRSCQEVEGRIVGAVIMIKLGMKKTREMRAMATATTKKINPISINIRSTERKISITRKNLRESTPHHQEQRPSRQRTATKQKILQDQLQVEMAVMPKM